MEKTEEQTTFQWKQTSIQRSKASWTAS